MNDIVIDTLDTLITLLQRAGATVLPAQRSEAERIVRAAWGGDRAYVAKLGEDGQRQMSSRDAAIRRDAARGAHVGLLARRYQLSARRIQYILQIGRGDDDPRDEPAAACLTHGAASRDAAQAAPNECPARHRAARTPHRTKDAPT